MSMSNRARRMLQHQLRNKADAELNLIPMIDIMSVMVSFLLVYSTEVQVVENPKGIEVPQSISQLKPRETVVITLTKDEIYVQGEAVASIDEVRASTAPVVAALSVALKRPSMTGQPLTDQQIADREVTVLADKSLPYEVLKKVMSTCTDADYGKISFALLQKDKPVTADSLRRSS
jgi:biopolymer transport protein ExbD